ncbi:MAG: bioY [Firmicutes bacterium]|nr:bioY [Bacillota bacterium]
MLRNMILTGLFAALITISSQIAFPLPFSPVPHTLQVLFIMLAGVLLGSRWGTMSVGIWITLGIFGLPVFAQGKAGITVLVGPTGGFIVGFLCCAALVGWLAAHWPLSYTRMFIVMLAGLFVIYACGLFGFIIGFTWLLHKAMSIQQGFLLVVMPFFPFDIFKIALAAFLGVRVRGALMQAGLLHN